MLSFACNNPPHGTRADVSASAPRKQQGTPTQDPVCVFNRVIFVSVLRGGIDQPKASRRAWIGDWRGWGSPSPARARRHSLSVSFVSLSLSRAHRKKKHNCYSKQQSWWLAAVGRPHAGCADKRKP